MSYSPPLAYYLRRRKTRPGGLLAGGVVDPGPGPDPEPDPEPTSWSPASLGAADKLRWDFTDAASLTVAGGQISGAQNKGSLGSVGNLSVADGATAPLFSSGVLSTSNGGCVATGDIDVADLFADLTTGTFYGIVDWTFYYVLIGASGWGGKFTIEGQGGSNVSWPNDGPEHGKLESWSQQMDTTPRIITIRKTATGKTVRLNGAQVATSEGENRDIDSFSGGSGPLCVGGYNPSGLFGAQCGWRGALGVADDFAFATTQKLEGWLAWKMSAAGDGQFVTALPSDHPYKVGAPT